MSDVDLLFQNIYKIPVRSMRINGSHPSMTRNKLWFIQISLVATINFSCFYLLCNSIIIYDIKNGNFMDACKNISMIVISVNTAVKFSVLLYHRQSITNLIGNIDYDYEQAKRLPPDEQDIVKRYAKKSHLVCVLWAACSMSASAVFPLKAFIFTAYSYWINENELKPLFELKFPTVIEENKDHPAVYWGFFALSFAFAFFASTMYVGFDPLIPIFTLHTCGQLDLLRARISVALIKSATLEEKEDNLKKIIKKLQEQYRFIDEVTITFKVINELNMKSTVLMLPLVSFNIVEDLSNNTINFEFFFLFLCAVFHFLLPCYFSDLLMDKSAEFRQSIYSCGWEKFPGKTVRQIVLLMLTRASHPLCISTVFYTISLDTYSAMIRQSYSLFNLMHAAWGK